MKTLELYYPMIQFLIITGILTWFMDLYCCRNLDIVDNMLQMMEKYTDQLEELVDERTRQLEIEKAKTEELLYKMLPK